MLCDIGPQVLRTLSVLLIGSFHDDHVKQMSIARHRFKKVSIPRIGNHFAQLGNQQVGISLVPSAVHNDIIYPELGQPVIMV